MRIDRELEKTIEAQELAWNEERSSRRAQAS